VITRELKLPGRKLRGYYSATHFKRWCLADKSAKTRDQLNAAVMPFAKVMQLPQLNDFKSLRDVSSTDVDVASTQLHSQMVLISGKARGSAPSSRYGGRTTTIDPLRMMVSRSMECRHAVNDRKEVTVKLKNSTSKLDFWPQLHQRYFPEASDFSRE